MAQPPIAYLKEASLTFGGNPLFHKTSIALSANERACLVGRNGSGKSTLLKALAGLIDIDHGQRFIQPGAHIVYIGQEPDFADAPSLLDYVLSGKPDDKDTTSIKDHHPNQDHDNDDFLTLKEFFTTTVKFAWNGLKEDAEDEERSAEDDGWVLLSETAKRRRLME